MVFAALARDGVVEGDAVGGFEGKVKESAAMAALAGRTIRGGLAIPQPSFSGPTNGVRCQKARGVGSYPVDMGTSTRAYRYSLDYPSARWRSIDSPITPRSGSDSLWSASAAPVGISGH